MEDGRTFWLTEDGSMSGRSNDRLEIQLPCRLSFPTVWAGSIYGITANLHRQGVLIACNLQPDRTVPEVGSEASVQIELPPNDRFGPKCMKCETVLTRIEKTGPTEFQFAMRIRDVNFEVLHAETAESLQMNAESCGYIM